MLTLAKPTDYSVKDLKFSAYVNNVITQPPILLKQDA